jgi:hypothetical protein
MNPNIPQPTPATTNPAGGNISPTPTPVSIINENINE